MKRFGVSRVNISVVVDVQDSIWSRPKNANSAMNMVFVGAKRTELTRIAMVIVRNYGKAGEDFGAVGGETEANLCVDSG